MRTLDEVAVGETVTVRRVTGEGAVKRRMLDLGLTKGCEVHVRKLAPLGDPMELTVRGQELTLRKQDAQLVQLLEEA